MTDLIKMAVSRGANFSYRNLFNRLSFDARIHFSVFVGIREV
jgi:hypothetical protein